MAREEKLDITRAEYTIVQQMNKLILSKDGKRTLRSA